MNYKKPLLLLSIFLLLIIFGCIQNKDEPFTQSPPRIVLDYKDENQFGKCERGNCTCMVCQNVSSLNIPLLSRVVDATLKGGNCSFMNPCNSTNYADIAKTTNLQVKTFLIGQGNSFSEFNDANTFCNNSLKLSVKWLHAKPGFTYPLPEKSRAECFLERDIIPMYILYSNGSNINSSRAEKIATTLNGSGPVIITTDIGFNSSSPNAVLSTKEQIEKMKKACPNCLIALAPKANDYDALTSILNNTPNQYYVGNLVDLIAFGINSHESTSCNGARTLYDILNFSKTAMHKYNKPSIIAYVMLEEGPGDPQANCQWTEDEISSLYGLLMESIPAMIKSGIIGAAPYSLYRNGPLRCTNCVLMKPSGAQLNAIDPYFTTWFSACEQYTTSYGAMPLVFPSKAGDSCSYAFNPNFYTTLEVTLSSTPELPSTPEQAPQFFRCDACVFNGDIPFTSSVLNGAQSNPPSGACPQSFDEPDEFRVLDMYADLRDLDPLFVRAIAWQESGFDKCAVSYVPKNTPTCNPIELTEITDPEGSCGTKTAPKSSDQNTPSKKLCAYGLMQLIEYPSTYYYDNYKDYKDMPVYAQECSQEDNYQFNPFNITHAACVGTYKLQEGFEEGLNIMSSPVYQDALDIKSTDDNKDDKIRFMAYFIAAHKYHGDWEDKWLSEFNGQKSLTAEKCGQQGAICPSDCYDNNGNFKTACCGNKDFFDYLKKCKQKTYGIDVMNKYLTLQQKCSDATCPDSKLWENIKKVVPSASSPQPSIPS